MEEAMTMAAHDEKSNGSSQTADSRWQEILAAAQKPEFEPGVFIRLVLSEMAHACQELELAAGHSSLEFKIKPLMARINALRTLAETARSVHDFTTQADVLDLGGRKFKYVLDVIIEFVKSSAQAANCNALQRQNIVQSVFSKLGENEEEIRRNLKDAQFLIAHEEEMQHRREAAKKSTPQN